MCELTCGLLAKRGVRNGCLDLRGRLGRALTHIRHTVDALKLVATAVERSRYCELKVRQASGDDVVLSLDVHAGPRSLGLNWHA